jgi:hypothetical protein
MAYGTIKVDTITFTDAGVDKSVTISGLVQNPTFSGNITVTGTVSGNTIQGQTVSGATITGGAAAFTTVTGGVATITSGVFALGSASNPSISFNGDANSGLYSPGADQVAVATNGTGRLFVSSAGTVGIDTNETNFNGQGSPLIVGNGSGNQGLTIYSGNNNFGTVQFADTATTGADSYRGVVAYKHGDEYMYFSTNATEKLRITSAGLVGIGTSAPGAAVHAERSGDLVLLLNRTASDGEVARFSVGGTTAFSFSTSGTARTIDSPSAVNLNFKVNGSDRVSIDSSGRVGIGSTSFGGKLTVKTSSSNGAPVAWGDGQLVVTAGDGTTAPGFGISTNTSDNSVSLSALTPGTGWNNLHLRAAQTIFYKSDAASNEVGRWDASGRLLVGTSSARTNFDSVFGAYAPIAQIETVTAGPTGLSIYNNNSSGYFPKLVLGISAGSSLGSNNLVANTNTLGILSFQGSDGSKPVEAATIKAVVDGTPGANDMPGRLVFSTTADGASSPTERMRIDSSGDLIKIGGVIKGERGTAAAPAYSFFDDTDTGIFNISNADLGFSVGGTERARIDASGRLLVGTSSTSAACTQLLQGSSGGLAPAIQVLSSTASAPANGLALAQITFTDSGHANAVDITARRDGGTWSGTSKPTRLEFSTTADGASSPTERMRIGQNGTLDTYGTPTEAAFTARVSYGAGTTYGLFSGRHTASDTSSGTNSFFVYTNGNVVNSNGSYGTLSDIKLKENIVDANSQWGDIKALQIRKYNFKEETGQQTHTQIGLVAQEVELVSPGLVTESPDRDDEGNDLGTTTKGVNQSVLYMKAVKALQEAMERIEQLETSNADLLARVTALESA